MPERRRRRIVRLACTLALVATRASGGDTRVCIDVAADIRALGSDDAFDSSPAAERLALLGPAAFPVLLRALAEEGPTAREAIVGLLADAPPTDAGVNRALARVARSDPEPGVRAVAIAAVHKLRGREGAPVLVAALDDPSPVVRHRAILACADACPGDAALARLVGLAIDDEPISNALEAQRALRGLSAEGADPARTAAIRRLAIAAVPADGGANPGGGSPRELRAAILLGELGDDSRLDAIAHAAGAGQPLGLRVPAIHALGRLGGADRVALLAGLLGDRDVAIHAHDALRRMASRDIAQADEAIAHYTGPRSPHPLPRP